MALRGTEIMIGDWIGIEYYATGVTIDEVIKVEKKTWPCKVVRIDDYSVTVSRLDGKVQACLVSDLIPIPLTDEILRNNGWEEILKESESVAAKFGRKPEGSGAWELYTKGMSVYVTPGLRYLPWVRIKGPAGQYDFNIRYVHELQHILRICHIDKEITI